jgi:hypothetical protein
LFVLSDSAFYLIGVIDAGPLLAAMSVHRAWRLAAYYQAIFCCVEIGSPDCTPVSRLTSPKH